MQDEVFGAQQKANVEPTTKYKFSVWHWTLNLQSDFSQMTTEQKHQFKNLVNFIFAEENIDKYLEDRTLPDDPRKNLAKVKNTIMRSVTHNTSCMSTVLSNSNTPEIIDCPTKK
jgi:hypothetical protein